MHRYIIEIVTDRRDGTNLVERNIVISQYDIRTKEGYEFFRGMIADLLQNFNENVSIDIKLDLPDAIVFN